MNYLKNRYPFKLLSNIFRIATRTSDALHSSFDIKRNKSDSALKIAVQNSNQESLNSKKNSSVNVTECQNAEKTLSGHALSEADSCNSLPLSKTSSEHSFGRVSDVNSEKCDILKRGKTNLDYELKTKLNKLRASLNSSVTSSREVLGQESRQSLKRAYPWQNFNLDSISQAELEDPPKRLARNRRSKNFTKLPLDHSMASASNLSLTATSSDRSLRTFKSISSTSLDRRSAHSGSDDIKNQMPLLKSILKKSAYKHKPVKELTFNNASTIYKPRSSYSVPKRVEDGGETKKKSSNSPETNQVKSDKDSLKLIKKKIPVPSDRNCLGRCEPLKAEHSFLHLYTSKRHKNFT